jgi:hypothetical protein
MDSKDYNNKRVIMKNYLTALLLNFLAFQGFAQITVLENSAERFTFTWKINGIDTTSKVVKGVQYNVLTFKGQNSVINDQNSISLPAYSLFLGVPQRGNVEMSLIPGEVSNLQLPNPLHENGNNRNNEYYFLYSPWISDPVYSYFGDYRTAQFLVRPVQYDPVSKVCKILLSGTVTLTFPQSSKRVSSKKSFPMLSSIVKNYDVAQYWQGIDGLKKKKAENYPIPRNTKMWTFKIGDGNSDLREGTTKENGLIKITGKKLIQLFGPGAVTINSIALFGSNKFALSEEVPDLGEIPHGIKDIPLVWQDDNKNGLVDSSDYCLTYATGTSDWRYDTGEFVYQVNRYSDYRTYWLVQKTTGASGMPAFSQPTELSIDTLDNFTNYAYYKNSALPSEESEEGVLRWMWKKFTTAQPYFQTAISDLPLLDPAFPGIINCNFFPGGSDFKISLGNTGSDSVVCNSCNDSIVINNWDRKIMTFEYTSTNKNAHAELHDITVKFKSKSKLDLVNQKFTLFSSSDSGIVTYRLSGLSNKKVYVVRIDTNEELSLVGAPENDSVFTWSDSGDIGVRYFISSESAINEISNFDYVSTVTPSSKYAYTDLRNISNKTDFLIITHPDFMSQSIELAAHKNKIGYSYPCVVDINDIYKHFSGGSKDPTAIRNFVSYIKRNWDAGTQFFYIVLMGIGHYDPKNYLTKEIDFIPIYQSRYGDLDEDYYCRILATTDTSQQLLDKKRPQYSIGRIPCRNKSEASAVVNKIVEMEDPSRMDPGPWRNRALFIADDDMQGDNYDQIAHHTSSDKVTNLIESNWPSIEMNKVYLFDYESDAAKEKPGAKQAIINGFNNGVAYVNYFGHGADVLWADEHVFRLEDIPALNNQKHYPLVSSFSCSVGKFDKPGQVCLSGALVTASASGAAAAISSTRVAYATTNENLAVSFYNQLFKQPSTNSIGAALYLARMNINEPNYAILGDPSLQFVNPSRSITLDIYDDSTGMRIDTLKAFQSVKVKGKVLQNGIVDNGFGSTGNKAIVNISLFNPNDSASRKDGVNREVRYLLPGKPVFVGKLAVQNGVFEQNILIPRSVAFNKKGVKLAGMAWIEGSSISAVGANDSSLIFNGYVQLNSNDTLGPQISIRPVYDDNLMNVSNVVLKDGIVSSLPTKFEIELYDPSGIDVANSGPDEGLTMEIPGGLAKSNINHKFAFKEGDFKQGKAVLDLQKNSLKEGTYDLNVSASDLIGNVSKQKFSLVITPGNDLQLDQVFNFPNPFRMNELTKFYFFHSNTSSENANASVTIKIYSLSGRLLRVFTNARNGVVWDGRDQAGTLLSPNVYLYQVTAKSSVLQKTVKSKVKKIVIHPPR